MNLEITANIILEILFMFEAFRYMRLYHGQANVKNKCLEYISYVIYYLANIIVFRFISLPIIMIILNITFLLLISLNYNSDNSKKILSVFTLFAATTTMESLALWLYEYSFPSIFRRLHFPEFTTYVIYLILFCFFVEICYKLKNMKQENILPHIFPLILSMNLMIVAYILYVASRRDIFQTILCGIFMLFLNFTISYFIKSISIQTKQKMEQSIIIEENKSFQKQIELMNIHTENNDSFRHKIKNNIILMKALIEDNKSSEALEHLNSIDLLLNKDKNVKSGVSIIDSVLNNKIFEARYRGIEVDCKIAIPVDIDYDNFDMTILLGNIMDFSIQQTDNAKHHPIIKLEVIFEIDLGGAGWLNIRTLHPVKSSSFENVQALKHIEKTVEKYDGHVFYDVIDDNIFKLNTKILIYHV